MKEAEALARSILGCAADAPTIALYERAIASRQASSITQRDLRRIAFAERHPASIPLLDAALALFDPRSELRYRLIVMAAVIETRPRYADRFLPRQRTHWFVLYIAALCIRSAAYAIVGSTLLLFVT